MILNKKTSCFCCFSTICLTLLAGPIYDLDSDSGRYLSFDDYSLTNGATPTWQHFGSMPVASSAAGLQAGSNHVHSSSWSFMHCRMGRGTFTTNSVLPVLNGNPYVPNGTNYCLYLQNRLEVLIHSPVFTDGIGTLYMDAISFAAYDVNLSIYIATNMLNGMGSPIPLDASANTNRDMIVWEVLPCDNLALLSGAAEVAYKKELNIRKPVCIKILRNEIFPPGVTRDNYYAVIDNLRVSAPPADVTMDQGNSPFDTYPSVNSNMNLRLKISNTTGPYTTTADQRTNVFVVSRWNYLGQRFTPWVTNAMTCVNNGDGQGNNELWQPLTPLPSYPDAGNLEYYFVCYFDGGYYQSKDYTIYPPVLNSGLFPPETKSPRNYSAAGLTQSGGTNTPFIIPLRLFPSSHDTVNTILFVNDSPIPQILPMTLSNTNRWQAKYDILNHPEVTNLLWYFEATGVYTNSFQTTSEKHYWQNISINRIQDWPLPYGASCGLTDTTITNRPGDWFGATVTPGESSYVLFSLDTATTNCSAGRGEYQNFNGWNVEAGAENFFTDSNDKYAKTPYTQSFSNGWAASSFSAKSNYFIGSALYTTTELNTLRTGPEQILNYPDWTAGAFQYVVERTVGNILPDFSGTASQRRNQAVRLFGGNPPFGAGYFQGNEIQRTSINGIGTVSYKARLSRPVATDPDYNYNVAYRFTDMARSNYMMTATGFRATSLSPERPSISLIAYYQTPLRFYEYRLSQVPDSRDLGTGSAINLGRDKRIKHEIWKWNGSNTPTLIASHERAVASWPDTTAAYDAKLSDTFDVEFRVSSDSGLTSLAAKFKGSIEIPFIVSNGATLNGTVVQDSSTPIRFGAYGFHSADCSMIFQTMSIKSTGTNALPGIDIPLSIIGGTSSNHQYEWYYPPTLYTVSANLFISANSPAPAAQVKVMTGTTETGPWTTFATHTVSSYTFQNFSTTTNDYRNLCARIEVDDTDHIVVDSIHVTNWRAISSTTCSPSDGWKITEGWVSSNATDKTYAHLDASQTDPSLIQGIRSTQLMGIGSIAFDYRVPAPPAKLKIQYTSNLVPSDTSNIGWIDVTNFVFAATNSWNSAKLILNIAPATNLYVRIINDLTFTNKSIIDLKNITLWNNPTNSPNDWAAYNMKITATETNKWWLDGNRSGYLNNGITNNIIPGRPMDQFEPYIMAPQLTRGLGTVSFLARAYTTNYVAGSTNTSITVYATTDVWNKYKPDAEWTKLHTFNNITNAFYRPFFYSYPNLPNNIKAVKLVVEGVRPLVGSPQRVCIDEIVLTEPAYPNFDITGVKMFLPGGDDPVETDQPLEGEAVGLEAQLTHLLNEPQAINLFATYVLGTESWGVTNAPAEHRITLPMTLVDAEKNIYRTSSPIPGQSKGTVVQYCVWAEYGEDGSHHAYQSPNTRDHFDSPPWYANDLNQIYAPHWSPYYIVAGSNALLSLTPSTYNIPYTGGVFSVFVGARSNWASHCTAPWIIPSETNGASATNVELVVTPNAATNTRSATIPYSCGNGSETLFIYQDPAPSSFDTALGTTNMTWILGGDSLWFEQTQTVKEGPSALQSGPITNNLQSWITTTVTGPGSLSFWWRVSSEGGYDKLTCSIDDSPQKSISGNKSGWMFERLTIGEGLHTIKWAYSKDESNNEGEDCGWLDELRWTPTSSLSGFALWANSIGLFGTQSELFGQDRDSDGVANGFEYAFGTNMPFASLLLNIRFVNGKAIIETPSQDESTLPFVNVHVKGSTNLVEWTLPMIPATNTVGKPYYRSWHETEGTQPSKAFFKLEAELR
jgi:hypothetical protein